MNAKEFLFDDEFNNNIQFMTSFWMQMVTLALTVDTLNQTSKSSYKRKSPNIQRNFQQSHLYYMQKYFWPDDLQQPNSYHFGPQQNSQSFQRRFRMPRHIFDMLLSTALTNSDFFRRGLRTNSVGKFGISPLLKVICALRQITHDISSDLCEDIFDMSETTAAMCLDEFRKTINKCLFQKYIREPTMDELYDIERKFANVGFPGCIDCLDCSRWEWQSCPKEYQGVMIGKEGIPTLRMEVICDLDLYIWSFQFGLPGGFNDLNVLEVSSYFEKVLLGKYPAVKPTYEIGGRVFDWYYYLTDGIYPEWKIFIQTIIEASTEKHKAFSKRQQAVRKSVERVFGVLFKRFKSLDSKCRKFNLEKIQQMANTAVIIHNLVVEYRRDHYTGDGGGGVSDLFECASSECTLAPYSAEENTSYLSQVQVCDDIKICGLHLRLKKALIDHIWNVLGDS